jgi:hypothetical protein
MDASPPVDRKKRAPSIGDAPQLRSAARILGGGQGVREELQCAPPRDRPRRALPRRRTCRQQWRAAEFLQRTRATHSNDPPGRRCGHHDGKARARHDGDDEPRPPMPHAPHARCPTKTAPRRRAGSPGRARPASGYRRLWCETKPSDGIRRHRSQPWKIVILSLGRRPVNTRDRRTNMRPRNTNGNSVGFPAEELRRRARFSACLGDHLFCRSPLAFRPFVSSLSRRTVSTALRISVSLKSAPIVEAICTSRTPNSR